MWLRSPCAEWGLSSLALARFQRCVRASGLRWEHWEILLIPVSVKNHSSEAEYGWTNELSKHQIMGWRAVSAAGLQGKGWHKRSVFSQTPLERYETRIALWVISSLSGEPSVHFSGTWTPRARRDRGGRGQLRRRASPIYNTSYVYTHMYIYIYIYIHMCISLSLSIYIYICMYVCMYVGIYVYVYICIHVCMYVCMYVCTYVRTYVCTYVRT